MLHDRSAHPVDLGVATDGLVVRVDHDDLEIFVGGVLTHPVGVEDAETLESASHALLGNGLQVPLWLLLLDGTRRLGLAVRATLGDGAFASTTSHGDAVNDEACNEPDGHLLAEKGDFMSLAEG